MAGGFAGCEGQLLGSIVIIRCQVGAGRGACGSGEGCDALNAAALTVGEVW